MASLLTARNVGIAEQRKNRMIKRNPQNREGSLDAFLVAINATNGNVIWRTAMVNPFGRFHDDRTAAHRKNGSVAAGVAGDRVELLVQSK